jgi:hypothetical protein
MKMTLVRPLILLLATSGCSAPPSVLLQQATLSADRWLEVERSGLTTKGKVASICFTLPGNYSDLLSSSSTAELLSTPDKKPLSLWASAIGPSGDTIPFGPPGVGSRTADEVRICFERRGDPIGRTFKAIRLRATDTLRISNLSWWSGNRHEFM